MSATAKLLRVWNPETKGVKFIPSEGFVVAGCQWKRLNQISVFQSRLAVKKEVYISKCHKCIQKHHKTEKIVFWSNFASAHYAKDTLVRLEELKIEYVPKEENPPNLSLIRPI
jgi:hypothetical protein